MKYNDHGFRPLYKNFCLYPITDRISSLIKDEKGAENADSVLVYGYIDHEAGLTLEILALTRKNKEGFSFVPIAEDTRMIVRICSVIDEEFDFVGYSDDEIRDNFIKKIDWIEDYKVNDEVEESRKFGFLDEFRSPEYPDDVLVFLLKEGLKSEGCWVRIQGLQDGCIIGTLLNEPDQDFGFHDGDTIAFFVHKFENGSTKLFSDMNPSQKITEEDLEDGSMLKAAIEKNNAERTKENFLDVMELLRDSNVWIPCNAILSDYDQEKLEKLVEETGGNLEELVKKEFTNDDNIRMVPDILMNGDKYFFPVFTSEDEMGDYGQNFSKLGQHFLEAINLARNNEKDIEGIVINAFSTPMVIPAELFEVIENMKSRLS